MATDSGKSRARLQERILTEAPRLTKEDTFQFACHPGVSCFGECCGDVNIVLTPYDVLRLKNRLGLGSGEFLEQHTIIPFSKEQKLPAPLIKMRDDEKKTCPFLVDAKCTVYEDRPWACRMYPLGFAAPGAGAEGEKEFYFLLDEAGCMGHQEEKLQTVHEWIADQGIEEYDGMGEHFKRLSLDAFFSSG
ncbi:MAG: YkgJ family cysteine cluster protein, partial [Planctomycetota bacterium]